MVKRAVLFVDDRNRRHRGAVGSHGRNRKEGLVENVGRGLHRIDRTAAAHAENHVGALHLFVRGDALDVGHRGVLAVDEPVDDFNAGLFETRTQLRTRLFKGRFTAHHGSRLAEEVGDFADIVVAIRTNAVMGQRHCVVFSHFVFSPLIGWERRLRASALLELRSEARIPGA